MGHLHATGAELSEDDRSERTIMGGLESISVEAFNEDLAYTALGHIHKAQRVGGTRVCTLCRQPASDVFLEQHYHHQVVAFTLENGCLSDLEAVPIPLEPPCIGFRRNRRRLPKSFFVAFQPTVGGRGEPIAAYGLIWEVQVLLTEPDPGFRHRVEGGAGG